MHEIRSCHLVNTPDTIRIRRCTLSLLGLVVLIFPALTIRADEIAIVSPPEYSNTDGDRATPSSCCPSYLRFQQVFPAEHFDSIVRGRVTGLAWRPDQFLLDPLVIGPTRWEIRLSTSEKEPGNLSSVYADNSGRNETTVLDGVRTIRAANTELDQPRTFDYVVQFDRPFLYDTQDGNLLVDYIFHDGIQPNPIADSYTYDGGDVAVATETPDSAGGGPLNWGLVHKFFIEPIPFLHAGDADQDLDFDQLDLVRVQVADKYLTGLTATWGDGDWDGAPGGEPGNPPRGNGLFDQIDFVAALHGGHYLAGPYATLARHGTAGDGQTSLVYNQTTGELQIDTPAGIQLTSINLTSANAWFIGERPNVLDGAFDNFDNDNIFKATFGGSFSSLSFGIVLPPGLSPAEGAVDLSAIGSLEGGGGLGDVDLIYVPEPTTFLLAWLSLTTCLTRRRQ